MYMWTNAGALTDALPHQVEQDYDDDQHNDCSYYGDHVDPDRRRLVCFFNQFFYEVLTLQRVEEEGGMNMNVQVAGPIALFPGSP